MQYVAWFYCKGGGEPVKREIKSAGKEIDWKWCIMYAIFLNNISFDKICVSIYEP